MNIKKFLIVSCIALQLSTIIHASQASFDQAFLKFGGGTDLATAAQSVENSRSKSSTRSVNGILGLSPSPEMTIVGKYLSNQTLSATELSSLADALAVAQGAAPAVDTTTDTTTTPVATTPVATTPTTTDTAATALKAQLDASVIVYNQYLTSVGQAQVKLS